MQRDRETGDASLELVVLAPIVLFLLGLVIAAGRTSLAAGAVAAAARDAARLAQASAQAELAQEGLHCSPAPVVNVDATAFLKSRAGQPAPVIATVTCHVPLSDLLLPGVPGSRTLQVTFTSPLDPYRGR